MIGSHPVWDLMVGDWRIFQLDPLGIVGPRFDGLILAEGVAAYPTKEAAVLRAQELADEKGLQFFVDQGSDRRYSRTLVTCYPASKLNALEPAPVPNGSRPIWDLVIADMQARDRVGRENYGTPLQAHNGRDALVDAYQEALDLCVYLRQVIEERGAK